MVKNNETLHTRALKKRKYLCSIIVYNYSFYKTYVFMYSNKLGNNFENSKKSSLEPIEPNVLITHASQYELKNLFIEFTANT